jgi:hypothetical protein
MRNLFILIGFAGIAALNSCTDHEVIPPPVPLVDLNCECEATIDDTLWAYNEICEYESTKNIVTEGLSSARYTTSIENEEVAGGLEIEIRSINWTDDGSNNPTLAEWQSWLDANLNPNYSDNPGHPGVEVRWTEPDGEVWISDTTASICVETFAFNTMIYESDTTGRYGQFDATFNCTLLNPTLGMKCLENAHVRSAFKLE